MKVRILEKIDWVMNTTTAGVRRGIIWKFTTALEDVDFADDTVLLSSKSHNLSERTWRMIEEASRVRLKWNYGKKCNTLRTESTSNEDKIVVNNEPMEDAREFMYLGVMRDKEGGGDRRITNRLQ